MNGDPCFNLCNSFCKYGGICVTLWTDQGPSSSCQCYEPVQVTPLLLTTINEITTEAVDTTTEEITTL